MRLMASSERVAEHEHGVAGMRARYGHKPGRLDASGAQTVRFEMPFDVRCLGCGARLPQGRRYNARKRREGAYLSTPVFGFTARCRACGAAFEIRTDPAERDFAAFAGVERVARPRALAEADEERARRERERTDPAARAARREADRAAGSAEAARLRGIGRIQLRAAFGDSTAAARAAFRRGRRERGRDADDARRVGLFVAPRLARLTPGLATEAEVAARSAVRQRGGRNGGAAGGIPSMVEAVRRARRRKAGRAARARRRKD